MALLETKPQILAFLKVNCPQFDRDKIEVKKKTYGGYEFTLISGGRMKKVVMYAHVVEFELHKFQAYFEGKPWTEEVYYQCYGCKEAPQFVLEYSSEKQMHHLMEKVRAFCGGRQNVGFRQVARPEYVMEAEDYLQGETRLKSFKK